jgi:16S rRNA (cytosine967-C5)-methyltransferase
MADDPRKRALSVLNNLVKKEKPLDRLLEEVDAENAPLDKRNRALFNTIVYGVLRWRSRLDWIIGHFSKVPLNRVDPLVLNILRLGAFQIVYLNRVPASAAVNTSVEMTKEIAPSWVVRFVNGVLRNLSRDFESVSFPDSQRDPVSSLAVEKSYPHWLVKRWVARFGMEETARLCDAMNSIPPITLRTNTLKTTRKLLMVSLRKDAKTIEPTRVAPEGVWMWNPKTSIPGLRAFSDGWFQVQDEAAQLVSLLLDPQPGESVLDACSGFGGKTGHIAQLMKNSGTLIASESDKEKRKRLVSDMERLGIKNVISLEHDLNRHPNCTPKIRYHRVLLDAPCSGLGVLRRNPDAKWSVTETDLRRHSERQLRFLRHVAEFVSPAGIVVYAVCSTEPEETESVVEKFLKHHPEFVIDKNHGGFPESARTLVNTGGFLFTFPHRNQMDGFFSVRFRRLR